MGNLSEAYRYRELYEAATQNVPMSRRGHPNRTFDNILKVATAMLHREIKYRVGNFTAEFRYLRSAIKRDDSLLYTEPWEWTVPTRHAFATLSLEQGHVEAAARAYAEDLGVAKRLTLAHQRPECVWALHGYHECLARLGQDKAIIKHQLNVAVAVAEVEIRSSCFVGWEP
ncbi:hypothetical protein BJX63DRAFT_437339 [Aspergillus granulosus]|uniref:Uncharacterized protein n=1 Tax=Aspergillus granulosus TaxID=176169 RepID=A0ABR4GVS1_9EURO